MKRDVVVLVTGGRTYEGRRAVFAALDRIHAERGVAMVIHGACCEREDKITLRGADRWAEEWAKEREVPYLGVPAPWAKLRKRAGMVRNGTMLQLRYTPDVVVAFPGGTGTAGMCELARRAGIPVWETVR